MEKNKFNNKNRKLSKKFNIYCLKHPEVEEQIPHNSILVFMPEYDPKFSKTSLEMATKLRNKNQPRVYVKVQRNLTQTSLRFTVEKTH